MKSFRLQPFIFLFLLSFVGITAGSAALTTDSTLQGHYRPTRDVTAQKQLAETAPTYGQLLAYTLPGLAAAGVGTLGLLKTIGVFRTGNSFLGLWALAALLGFGAAWWLLTRPSKRPLPPDERRLLRHRQWVLLALLTALFGLASLLFIF